MSDKTKIKQFKIRMESNSELREQLRELVEGKRDSLEIDCVYFEDLSVEEVKNDCFKVEELKLKRGRIHHLKIKFEEPRC